MSNNLVPLIIMEWHLVGSRGFRYPMIVGSEDMIYWRHLPGPTILLPLITANSKPSFNYSHILATSKNISIMGKKSADPETSESIIARHKQAQEPHDLFINKARDAKRKAAAAQGIAIPKWERYWEDLDEWRSLVIEQEIDRDLYQHGFAPTPPTSPIPRPLKPKDLEDVGGNSKE